MKCYLLSNLIIDISFLVLISSIKIGQLVSCKKPEHATVVTRLYYIVLIDVRNLTPFKPFWRFREFLSID